MQEWISRYTVRRFDRTKVPADNIIKNIKDTVQYIPSQLGAVDHIWCLCGPNDQELKDWLVKNIYYCDDSKMNHREYFSALADAPYMFTSLSLKIPHPSFIDFELTNAEQHSFRQIKENEYRRNNAFHAGILVSQGLRYGLDCCQIACTEGWSQSIADAYYDKVWERFGEELSKLHVQFTNGKVYFSKDLIDKPLMSVGMGTGLPTTDHSFSVYENGVSFTGQKSKKWFANIVE